MIFSPFMDPDDESNYEEPYYDLDALERRCFDDYTSFFAEFGSLPIFITERIQRKNENEDD